MSCRGVHGPMIPSFLPALGGLSGPGMPAMAPDAEMDALLDAYEMGAMPGRPMVSGGLGNTGLGVDPALLQQMQAMRTQANAMGPMGAGMNPMGMGGMQNPMMMQQLMQQIMEMLQLLVMLQMFGAMNQNGGQNGGGGMNGGGGGGMNGGGGGGMNGAGRPGRPGRGKHHRAGGGHRAGDAKGMDGIPPVSGGASGPVSAADLRRVVPSLSESRARELVPHLNKAMQEAGINTKREQAAFIAQLAHESAGFKAFEEYASGAAYEGRRDLGNTHPGDGRRYKGRGPIQLTGRANYRAAGQALGVDLEGHPELAARPDIGFRVAAWYWKSRGLNAIAERGDFREVTRRINGGYNGLAAREDYYRRALQVV